MNYQLFDNMKAAMLLYFMNMAFASQISGNTMHRTGKFETLL